MCAGAQASQPPACVGFWMAEQRVTLWLLQCGTCCWWAAPWQAQALATAVRALEAAACRGRGLQRPSEVLARLSAPWRSAEQKTWRREGTPCLPGRPQL